MTSQENVMIEKDLEREFQQVELVFGKMFHAKRFI